MRGVKDTTGQFLGFGAIRTRGVTVIGCVCWCRSDRGTGSVMVWLAVGRVFGLQVCRLRCGGGILCKVVSIGL